MTSIFRITFAFSLCVFAAAAVSAAQAHDFKVGALDIGHPWSRPTPKDANIAGGYLTITNKGKVADRLIGGASPAASQIEVHEMANVDGMMKTRPLTGGLEIKPGKTIELKPGAYRLVLLGLKEPLQIGQKVKGTLVFEKAGPVEIVYNVEENPEASKCHQWLRTTQASLRRCAFACLTGWTTGAFTPCSNWRAPHRQRSQQRRERCRASRELRLRRPRFSASRRTDGKIGWKENSNDAGSLPSPTAATWTRHSSPGRTTRSSPNAGRRRRPAANRPGKMGELQPQCWAHRCSGSHWPSLPSPS